MPGPLEAVKHVSAITELQKVLKSWKKKKKKKELKLPRALSFKTLFKKKINKSFCTHTFSL